MTNHWTAETAFDVFADDIARQIMTKAATDPKSATELVDICDCSRSAIYRRLHVMTQMGLLKEQNWITKDGSHHNVYVAASTELKLQITEDSIDLMPF